MTVLDERAHESEEECQKQGSDVRAVDVGIRHDDYFAVAQLAEVKVLADARAKRSNDRGELIVAVNAVDTGFFNVEHLTPQGQDSLELSVPAFLCRAARRISLDDIDLGDGSISLGAVSELARQAGRFKRALSSCKLSCLFSGFSCFLRLNGFIEDSLCNRRVFLEIVHQLFGDELIDERSYLGVAETSLCLSLELAVCELDGNYRGKSLTHVLCKQLVIVFEIAELFAVFVYNSRQCDTEACFVRTAVGSVDIVCK